MPEDFDFAFWSSLAREDPAAFEAARREALERIIREGERPEFLRRMQWRLDAERRRARTPLKACLRFSGMMWETFFSLRDALNGLAGRDEERVSARFAREPAAVLCFRR